MLVRMTGFLQEISHYLLRFDVYKIDAGKYQKGCIPEELKIEKTG